jgi:hypothetical protein
VNVVGREEPVHARASHDLLRHLALIGELCERREQLSSQLETVDRLLAQARHQKPLLVKRLEELGGALPVWEL